MKIIDYVIEGETKLKNPWVNKHVARNVGSMESVTKWIVPLKNSNIIFPSSALCMDHTQEWLIVTIRTDSTGEKVTHGGTSLGWTKWD